jgi:hypothetical protein
VLGGVHQQLEVVIALEEAVLGDQVDGAHDGGAAWLVLVEQVAGEQDEVHVVVRRQLQHLLEGAERVVLPDFVLLPDALRWRWGGTGRQARNCAIDAGPAARPGGPLLVAMVDWRLTKWLSVDTSTFRCPLRAGGQAGIVEGARAASARLQGARHTRAIPLTDRRPRPSSVLCDRGSCAKQFQE